MNNIDMNAIFMPIFFKTVLKGINSTLPLSRFLM